MCQAGLAQFSSIRFGGIVVAFHFSVPGAVHHVVELCEYRFVHTRFGQVPASHEGTASSSYTVGFEGDMSHNDSAVRHCYGSSYPFPPTSQQASSNYAFSSTNIPVEPHHGFWVSFPIVAAQPAWHQQMAT